MALNTKKIKSGGNRVEQPVLEIAIYPARLAQVIDLGLQARRAYKGEAKSPVHQMSLTYELVDAFMVDENGEEVLDKPRWLSEDLNMFGPDADLAKCNKRYKAIDPDEVHEYNWAEVAGSSCSVATVHKESKGKTYANVGTVTPYIPSKRNPELPELQKAPVVFDLDEPDMEVFDSLPEWIQDKIKANLEFKGSPLELALGGTSAPQEEPEEEEGEEESNGDW